MLEADTAVESMLSSWDVDVETQRGRFVTAVVVTARYDEHRIPGDQIATFVLSTLRAAGLEQIIVVA